jgi:hypothetical protein
MSFVLCHSGEHPVDETEDTEVACDAVAHPEWVAAVENAGGPDVAFGRCRNCGELVDPEGESLRGWLVQAFESAKLNRS